MDHSWIDRNEYPFESHYFETPSGRMHYIDEGSGEALVMIHGNPTWSFLYRQMVKDLRGDFRCIALDHIGFGLSDKPEGFSYLPEDHAKNLERLLDYLGLENITLVLHDWGGPIGLDFATSHPARIRGFVIMNTWAWPVVDDSYYRFFSGFMGGPIGKYLITRHNFFTKSLIRQLSADGSRLKRATHLHYTAPFDQPETRIGSWMFPRSVIGSTDWLRRIWDQRDRIVDKDMLIFWGMRDTAFRNKELRIWRDCFTRSELVKLWNVGHYVPEESSHVITPRIKTFFAN